MTISGDDVRVAYPLLQTESSGSIPTSPLHARDLVFEPCPKAHSVLLVRQWHSRLPNCQQGPWTHSFRGHYNEITYVVALWNTPSARCLPSNWLELRRMACSPDVPKNTPSRFLSWMVRWFKFHEPYYKHLISYQDTEVHRGIIYKASGWIPEWKTVERIRDRTGNRVNTTRKYRSNINGEKTDSVSKVRWGIDLWEAVDDDDAGT